MIDPNVLQYLRCPVSESPMRLASDDELSSINQQIENGSVRNRLGNKTEQPLAGGLINADGTLLMEIRDGVINTIPDELIEIGDQ